MADTYRAHQLQSTIIANATDIAAAKAGYRVVLYGLMLTGATPGKLQSNATTDLSGVLPTGNMFTPQPDFIVKSAVGEKLNITGAAQTGLAIWAYERVVTVTQNF